MAVAILLSFVIPPIFTGIAFDSGGIASGTMTVAFILPICTGLSGIINEGNIITEAFGLAGIVASVPILTIEILGLIYMVLDKKNRRQHDKRNSNNDSK